jgi:hypothetical protein
MVDQALSNSLGLTVLGTRITMEEKTFIGPQQSRDYSTETRAKQPNRIHPRVKAGKKFERLMRRDSYQAFLNRSSIVRSQNRLQNNLRRPAITFKFSGALTEYLFDKLQTFFEKNFSEDFDVDAKISRRYFERTTTPKEGKRAKIANYDAYGLQTYDEEGLPSKKRKLDDEMKMHISQQVPGS